MIGDFLAAAHRWKGLGRPLPPADRDDLGALGRARHLIETTAQSFEVRTELDKETLYALVATVLDELVAHDPRGPGDRVTARRILRTVRWADDYSFELEDLSKRLSLDPSSPIDFSRSSRRSAIELARVILEEMDLRPADITLKCNALFEDRSKQGSDFFPDLAGELALIQGAGYRILNDSSKATEWLDAADEYWRTLATPIDRARLQFQRVAVAVTRRLFSKALPTARRLQREFQNLGLIELELKTEILIGSLLKEMGEVSQALDLLERVSEKAKRAGSAKMLAYSLVGLASRWADFGDEEQTRQFWGRAERALEVFPNPVALAKLHCNLGDFFRNRRQYEEAEIVYRRGLAELQELRLDGDIAGTRLVLADVLLAMDRKRDAVAEISEAMPVILRLDLAGEAAAAMALLRDSIGRNSPDRDVICDLRNRLMHKP